MRRQRTLRPRGGTENGAILPLAALLLTVMLAFAGFGVDLGWWYSRAAQLQKAADAAALAAVVWMPDTAKALVAAQNSLKSNGIVAGGQIAVTYTPIEPDRYQVTVTDSKVAAYFTRVFTGDISETRGSTAEYELAVPLGSPWNHLGTGSENIYAAVNGFCTSKEDGDLRLSRFDAVKSGSPANRCPSTASAPAGPGPNGTYKDNADYTPNGYSYYIDLPAVRLTSTRVVLFDAAYFNNDASSPDLNLNGGSPTVTTTYRVRAPDSTPLDDTDNPVYSGCGATNPRSFATNDNTFGITISGSNRYTLVCTIPTTAPGGKYILDVYTLQSQGVSQAANAYGIFLEKGSSTATCDSRTDATCPRIYGTDSISVYANKSSSTAQFYLAEIGAQYAGKPARIDLWDPGEGGNTIQLLDPNGTPFTFSYASEDGVYTGTGVTSLSVTGSKFNDSKVSLTFTLPANYAIVYATSNWWQLKYSFTSGTVTDRTTWSVNILDLPVHLVG